LFGAIFLASAAAAGSLTTNEFLYKPALGARGTVEKTLYDQGLDRLDARLGKEIWVGDPKYGTTLPAVLTAIGSSPAILRVPAGAWNITSDLTVPANVSLKPERGAILAVATAKTLTINGPVEAGPYPIFTLTGTGAVVLNGAQDKVFAAWFPGADIGAKINYAVAAVSSTKAVPIIVTSEEWCGASYATGIVVSKPVWIQFPGIRNSAAVYTGTEAACKLTVNGARVTGFRVDLTGNLNSNVDGFVIYGASDCIIDGGISIDYSTVSGTVMRRWVSIDGGADGAYQNVFIGPMRLTAPTPGAATGGTFLWIGSSGAGFSNANQIQHVVFTGKIPDNGYGLVFNKGYNNHIGQLYGNAGGATVWGIWVESTVGGMNYIGTCTLDSAIAGGGIKVDAAYLTIGQLFNNVAGTKETINRPAATFSYNSQSTYFPEEISTRNLILQNVKTAFGVAAAPSIYGSNSGGTYPFTELGNLILSSRTSVGAPRDIVFVTGDPPVTVATITRMGGIRGLLATNGPVGTFTLAAAAETTVANTIVTTNSKIFLFPNNAAAATLMGSAKCLYISGRSGGTSFKVKTADASAAAGTEEFQYLVLN
jgi:hypothetical protein